jgi:dTDP-4-amino-4,6-dideoxygalactose transaminase
MATLAVNGGEPVRTAHYPEWPTYDQREEEALLGVLHSRSWGGIPGERGQEFARAFAEVQGARYGAVLTNGTAALQVSLAAAGVRWGDEVLMPAVTWIATPQAALYLGAVPVFVDVDPDTYNIDPRQIEAKITPRTKAIIPVHLGGLPADLDGVLEIAKRHGLKVIEDCAHGHGAKWRGRGVGSWGDFGIFSFQQSKVMTCGEGGLILTNDKRLAELATSMINCGRIPKDSEYLEASPFNYNFRMTEFQAAILLAQLTRLEEWTAKREAGARYLDSELGKIEGLRPLRRDERVTRTSYYLYRFRYSGAAFGGRSLDAFVTALQAEGIPASTIRSNLVYRYPLYAASATDCCAFQVHATQPVDYSGTLCPEAERIAAEEAVVLPQYLLLGSEEDLQDVVRAARKIKEHAQELAPAG